MDWLDWHNLYDLSWDGLIVPEAFAHPAKAARGVLEKIIGYGFEQGFWERGSVIGDCFGGVGTTGIVGASRGLQVVSVELEERFFHLSLQNYELHRPVWQRCGDPLPVMVRGDSREFARLVGGTLGAAVSSPPFLATEGGCKVARSGPINSALMSRHNATGNDRYGTTQGQVGALRAGDLAAVLTSPPYAECVQGEHGEQETAEESMAKRKTPGGSLGQSCRNGGYGKEAGQVGALKEGELSAVVTSPPYEGTPVVDPPRGREGGASGGIGTQYKLGNRPKGAGRKADGQYTESYGGATGQIGVTAGETYWSAVKAIYGQVHSCLRPQGVFALIVKDYIKAKRRVPLCDQTCQLLTALNFQVFLRCRCWLVKEDRHPGLFGEDVVETKSRKSFFRRLYEKKHPQNRIDWEEVIWCRK